MKNKISGCCVAHIERQIFIIFFFFCIVDIGENHHFGHHFLFISISCFCLFQIEPGDPLPKTICKKCIYRLQCHHKLMRQITLARKRLSKKMEAVQERVHVFQREGTPPPNNFSNFPENLVTVSFQRTPSHISSSSSQPQSDFSSSSQVDFETEQATQSILSDIN